MAEQLAFQQRRRDGGAVHGDEGPPGAPAVAMDGARHHLLAGAGLAGDQHGGLAVGEPADGFLHLAHRRRRADQLVLAGLDGRCGGRCRGGQHARDQASQVVAPDRLGQVIDGAQAHRLDSVGRRRHRRQHRHRRRAGAGRAGGAAPRCRRCPACAGRAARRRCRRARAAPARPRRRRPAPERGRGRRRSRRCSRAAPASSSTIRMWAMSAQAGKWRRHLSPRRGSASISRPPCDLGQFAGDRQAEPGAVGPAGDEGLEQRARATPGRRPARCRARRWPGRCPRPFRAAPPGRRAVHAGARW